MIGVLKSFEVNARDCNKSINSSGEVGLAIVVASTIPLAISC